MRTDISFLPIMAAATIYVFGVITLSLHVVQSLAILTVQGNSAAAVLEHLLDF
jgi:hypothetical protein